MVKPIPSRFQVGATIHTTQDARRTDWAAGANRARAQWGRPVMVLAVHDSHGLCYDVKHADGTVVVYDHDELDWRKPIMPTPITASEFAARHNTSTPTPITPEEAHTAREAAQDRIRAYKDARALEIAALQEKWPRAWLRETMLRSTRDVLGEHHGWSGCEGDFDCGGRALAALALREAMSDLSENYDCSSWGIYIPELHWQWLRGEGRPERACAARLATIRKLAEASGYWWADQDVAVPLEDWAKEMGSLP